MATSSVLDRLSKKVQLFRSANAGNVITTFALALVPMAGAVGAAIDFSQANSVKSAMQAASDVAALGTIKVASTLPSSEVQSTAVNLFTPSFNRTGITPSVSAQYDSSQATVTITTTATVKANFMGLFGFAQIPVKAVSKATIGPKMWQVCVMVTNPNSNHTLLTKNAAQVNFDNCMVQVNTQNWDAVEARDTSYIHSTNGENCFVGDIHYGDIVPPKNPTCTFFPDPFASYTVPTNACTYTNKSVTTAGTVLSPGTYCGGIAISKDVTFSPGIYYIQNGDLKITNAANVTATNVTFLITGNNSNLNITTTGTLTMSPYTDAAAGQWAGFVVFYDQPSTSKGVSVIQNAKVNASGIFYLVNQTLSITNKAVVTINPGSVLADFILPDGGVLNVTGELNSSLAVLQAMQKTGATTTAPKLTQ